MTTHRQWLAAAAVAVVLAACSATPQTNDMHPRRASAIATATHTARSQAATPRSADRPTVLPTQRPTIPPPLFSPTLPGFVALQDLGNAAVGEANELIDEYNAAMDAMDRVAIAAASAAMMEWSNAKLSELDKIPVETCPEAHDLVRQMVEALGTMGDATNRLLTETDPQRAELLANMADMAWTMAHGSWEQMRLGFGVSCQ